MGADGALDMNSCKKNELIYGGKQFFHLYRDDLFPEYGIQIRAKYGNECLIYKYTDR